MGKGSSTPPAPDYNAAVQNQGAANTNAAQQTAQLSNPNIISPYGNQTVSFDGNQPTITQTLTPTAQQTLNQQQQTQLGLSQTANQQQQNVGNLLNTPFSFGGQAQTSLGNAGPLVAASDTNNYATSVTAPTAQAQGGVAAPNLQNSVNMSGIGQVNQAPSGGQYGQASGVNGSPQLQGQLNTSGVASAAINPGTTAQQAILSRLQPTLQANRTSAETQLVNQGLRPGTQAYDAAERNLGNQENDQYTQAALQGINLDQAANQQGFNQAQASGQFANQSALDQYNAGLSGQQLANNAIGQNFNQGLASQQAGNAAQGQQFNQAVQSGQFGNDAQLASFNAGLQNQQAGNNAIGQNFAQSINGQQAANAATNQNYQNTLSGMQAQNAAQNQIFNQNLQSGQFNNTAIQQQLAQALQQRDLPLNEINSLLSGSQIQNPQFSPYTGSTVAPNPVLAGTQSAAQYNQNQAAIQAAGKNSLLSGLYGLGGAAITAL